MYDYAYKTSVGGFYTFKLVTFIIAIAATIIIYTVFMDKRNKDTYSNPLKKLFDYLHFNYNHHCHSNPGRDSSMPSCL